MALAKTLQHCTVWSGAPPSTMCCTVQDLCRCLVPLLQLEEEDFLEASLLESAEEEDSLTPAEEALLLNEDPELQGARASPCVSPSSQKRLSSLKSQPEQQILCVGSDNCHCHHWGSGHPPWCLAHHPWKT